MLPAGSEEGRPHVDGVIGDAVAQFLVGAAELAAAVTVEKLAVVFGHYDTLAQRFSESVGWWSCSKEGGVFSTIVLQREDRFRRLGALLSNQCLCCAFRADGVAPILSRMSCRTCCPPDSEDSMFCNSEADDKVRLNLHATAFIAL